MELRQLQQQEKLANNETNYYFLMNLREKIHEEKVKFQFFTLIKSRGTILSHRKKLFHDIKLPKKFQFKIICCFSLWKKSGA